MKQRLDRPPLNINPGRDDFNFADDHLHLHLLLIQTLNVLFPGHCTYFFTLPAAALPVHRFAHYLRGLLFCLRFAKSTQLLVPPRNLHSGHRDSATLHHFSCNTDNCSLPIAKPARLWCAPRLTKRSIGLQVLDPADLSSRPLCADRSSSALGGDDSGPLGGLHLRHNGASHRRARSLRRTHYSIPCIRSSARSPTNPDISWPIDDSQLYS